MLTGVTTRAQVEALPDDERPTAVAADADELAAALDTIAAVPPATVPRAAGAPPA